MLQYPSMFLATLLLLAASPNDADFVIRNVTLLDGIGQPARQGDLAIGGERISGEGTGRPRIIDGHGLIAAPGFIDLHTHSDATLPFPPTNANHCYLRQGVTTVITGNCGQGPTDVAAYFKKLQIRGIGSNVIHLVPHNEIRRQILGNADRAPTAQELRKMEALVERGMREGAWGLSTGLIYEPGAYARTAELFALARVAARHDGLYASHIRDEGAGLLAAIAEALTIGREAGVPVHVSHVKATGPHARGKAADVIALLRQARARGQKVTADQYPYTASSTSLAALVIPPRFRAGTARDFRARLEDAEQGPRIRQAIEDLIGGPEGAKSLRLATYAAKPAWQGKDLQTIAAAEHTSPVDVVLTIERHGGAVVIDFGMREEDVCLFMKEDYVATASDGYSQLPGGTLPHPRSYGCFPRKIGFYALQEGVLSLAQAVRSASGLPADILGLTDRGYLKVGYYADVVVFDPKTFRDRATYDQPHQYATGVRYLFVNGRLVIDNGQYTKVLAGKVLQKPQRQP
jgi:N-acyl-D-aspartate/D-glutamate deacylase